MNPTVIGEALVDVLASGIAPAQEFVGGSPLNVAVALSRLGYPGTLISRWGADGKGRKIEDYLKDNNVAYLGGADDEATVIAHGILDPAGGAAFAFNAYWQMPTIGPELAQDAELVHTGSIATLFSPEELLPLLSAARTHATISYDPNLRPSLVTNHAQTVAEVERFVGQADVVRVSGIDLKWLYPMRSVRDSARAWLDMGPAIVVSTAGSQGSWGVVRAGDAEFTSPSVEVTDTVGAGDTFTAALLCWLAEHQMIGAGNREKLNQLKISELSQALEFAAMAAAVTVQRAGANPPHREEL
ncbi:MULTISPECIES: PfkB family carbohydrate kinase [Glutamicibacter]|uniref:Carbohydrate kinase n=1 Tax=Glutamicibacter arilaitensis TaxID=256701 RepID=A0A2N7S0T4_9MICC|nr:MULTISPECIES: PfkB family carbohydrate kinase [Glutamicibacter]PMQ19747.1 carbohydrate kinase [Glutamicibacter arilaitensis]HCJ55009.1 carbohydrate kinase [Glutamicibacter sp.]HCM95087.1 carbohydrate kinase [Glutamicibacter sp.]